MCEPNHSIVQYPGDRGDGSPTEILLGPSIKDKILEVGKKILGWLHFSKLGTGHSEAIRQLGRLSSLIPEETRWEARWWDRTVVLDGKFNGEAYDLELASTASQEYAKAVSIGSLSALRNFLEVSLRKTNAPYMYVSGFLYNLIKPQGRDIVANKLKRCLGIKRLDIYKLIGHRPDSATVQRITKVLLGFTRNRDVLCDAWADDSSLWLPRGELTPGQERVEGLPSPLMGI